MADSRHLPARLPAGPDLGLHREGEVQARRRQRLRRPLEQQPRRARQRPAGAGRQTVRRVEHCPRPHGRRARERLAESASSSWTTPCWRTTTTARRPCRPKARSSSRPTAAKSAGATSSSARSGPTRPTRFSPAVATKASSPSSMATTSPAGPARPMNTRSWMAPSSAVRTKAAPSTPPTNTPTSWPAWRSSCRPGQQRPRDPLPRPRRHRLPRHVRKPGARRQLRKGHRRED